MKVNEVAVLYKNLFEEGTAKGSFFIDDKGLMAPRTRNITLWGLASSLSIPEEFRNNPNIVTSLKHKLPTSPETPLSAFFKFQKTLTSTFTEAVGMEIASHFNTPTCFNYPANIDDSPNSLYRAVCPYLDTKTQYGNMIFSFLGRDEELVTFYKMAVAQETSYDVMTLTELVPNFVSSHLPQLSSTQAKNTISNIQQNFAYQYLLRDYLGDIDFTSKNSGIILNRQLGYARIAPNFDFGEILNHLITNKFSKPELDSVENYPEYLRSIMTQDKIDKINASKLERYNTPVSEIAKRNTFDDKSDINIQFICRAFPQVAERFKQDLGAFSESGLLPQIIGKYVGEDNLITEEQGSLCLEYFEERSKVFDRKLEDNLSQVPQELRYASYEEILEDDELAQGSSQGDDTTYSFEEGAPITDTAKSGGYASEEDAYQKINIGKQTLKDSQSINASQPTSNIMDLDGINQQ